MKIVGKDMTVKQLIKLLEKMPPRTQLAVDVSYNNSKKEWKYETVSLNPELVNQVPMHPDWHENQPGKPKFLNMCILGTIVGNYLE